MTLIELLILLSIVFVVVFIALPTLKPAKQSDVERFARRHISYLYERERAFFLRNGKYNSFAVLALPENGGPFLDQRYTGTEYRERGVVFRGPDGETSELVITAELPGGDKFLKIDSKGRITEHQGKPERSAETQPAPQQADEAVPTPNSDENDASEIAAPGSEVDSPDSPPPHAGDESSSV